MIEVIPVNVTPFQQICRILYIPGSAEAVVVDPGADVPKIQEGLEKAGLNLNEIWLTHSHLDHCGGVAKLKKAFPSARLYGHEAEKILRENVESTADMFGVGSGIMENCPEPDVYLKGGEVLKLGTAEFKVLFCPGHTPGHLVFYCEEEKLLIVGDVIFAGSIGRTDLPGGDYNTLISSIKNNILTLPDDMRILSGHGPQTTVGTEKRTNPYLSN